MPSNAQAPDVVYTPELKEKPLLLQLGPETGDVRVQGLDVAIQLIVMVGQGFELPNERSGDFVLFPGDGQLQVLLQGFPRPVLPFPPRILARGQHAGQPRLLPVQLLPHVPEVLPEEEVPVLHLVHHPVDVGFAEPDEPSQCSHDSLLLRYVVFPTILTSWIFFPGILHTAGSWS